LAYIADFFTAVEVNTSFYRPVTTRMTESWVRRTRRAKAFRFAFKLTSTFTHDRAPYDETAVESFREGVSPVVDAGMFGCLLIQFPWSFKRTDEACDWIRRLCDDFSALPLAVEVRHQSWDDWEWRLEMGERDVSVCRIDQPALRGCLGVTESPPTTRAYFRFHGRRADTWFADDVPVYERYNYLYTDAELEPWVERMKRSADSSDEVFVFTNNHYRGQAPANALQLRAMIEGRPVAVPQPLADAFPQLKTIRRPSSSFPTSLFD